VQVDLNVNSDGALECIGQIQLRKVHVDLQGSLR